MHSFPPIRPGSITEFPLLGRLLSSVPHQDRLALGSHDSGINCANIILLLNLAAKAEKSGFLGFARYLVQEAFQKLEQKLEGLERELEGEKKPGDHYPTLTIQQNFCWGNAPKKERLYNASSPKHSKRGQEKGPRGG